MTLDTKINQEWVCPRCARHNSNKNEVCMGAEMGDGRCGYPKSTAMQKKKMVHKTDSRIVEKRKLQ